MRKITKNTARAWNLGINFKESNTEIVDSTLYLFGNKIAWLDEEGKLFFTLAGWNSNTTRERLQAVGVSVSQKNFKPIWNGQEIDAWGVYEVV